MVVNSAKKEAYSIHGWSGERLRTKCLLYQSMALLSRVRIFINSLMMSAKATEML